MIERVLVLGCSGTGKTTLARRLGAATGLPVVHLDQHYWRPGWVEPHPVTWAGQVKDLAAQPRWIIEGNYARSLPLRLTRADTAIYLDLPTWLCLLRVLLRVLRSRGRVRSDMAPGCPERYDWEFVKYVLGFRRRRMPETLAALEGFAGRKVVLRSRRAIADFTL